MTRAKTSLRLDSETQGRADALVPYLAAQPAAAAAGPRVTRAAVLRLAMWKGLAALEEELVVP